MHQLVAVHRRAVSGSDGRIVDSRRHTRIFQRRGDRVHAYGSSLRNLHEDEMGLFPPRDEDADKIVRSPHVLSEPQQQRCPARRARGTERK